MSVYIYIYTLRERERAFTRVCKQAGTPSKKSSTAHACLHKHKYMNSCHTHIRTQCIKPTQYNIITVTQATPFTSKALQSPPVRSSTRCVHLSFHSLLCKHCWMSYVSHRVKESPLSDISPVELFLGLICVMCLAMSLSSSLCVRWNPTRKWLANYCTSLPRSLVVLSIDYHWVFIIKHTCTCLVLEYNLSCAFCFFVSS